MVSARLVLDIRRATKKGYPVKIRGIDKVTRYVGTSIFQKNEVL